MNPHANARNCLLRDNGVELLLAGLQCANTV